MTVQQRDSIPGLIAALHQGSIDRRSFMRRAAGAGLSAALIGSVVARYDSVSAQDASPAAGTVAQDIGLQNVEHVTDTSKGTIKLYSSWPLTGGMERTGNDAVAAFQMALEDFGGAAGGFALTYEALDDGVAANNGGWEAGKETENVNRVINDPDAVVYIATYNSGAAKISIPITNEAGMAQVSYANTYTGLTGRSRAPPRRASRISTTRPASATTCACARPTTSRASRRPTGPPVSRPGPRPTCSTTRASMVRASRRSSATSSRPTAARSSASRATTPRPPTTSR
jgi:hypothetical protein